jgi:hypothetical protein
MIGNRAESHHSPSGTSDSRRISRERRRQNRLLSDNHKINRICGRIETASRQELWFLRLGRE